MITQITWVADLEYPLSYVLPDFQLILQLNSHVFVSSNPLGWIWPILMTFFLKHFTWKRKVWKEKLFLPSLEFMYIYEKSCRKSLTIILLFLKFGEHDNEIHIIFIDHLPVMRTAVYGWALTCHKCNFRTRILGKICSICNPTSIDVINTINGHLKFDPVLVVW